MGTGRIPRARHPWGQVPRPDRERPLKHDGDPLWVPVADPNKRTHGRVGRVLRRSIPTMKLAGGPKVALPPTNLERLPPAILSSPPPGA
jgi:hypothetical protein